MNLVQQIKTDRIQAMKDKNLAKRNTLQLLLAKIEKEQIELKTELTKEQVEAVVSHTIKELEKEIKSYKNVGRETTSQEDEIELLLTYLPRQLSEEEIREVVKHVIGMVENGEIAHPMGYISTQLKGKANMGLVRKIVEEMS